MIIYPAIDLKSGKCVRLFQGKMDEVTVYSDSPRDMAMSWEDQGAEYIHLVDLDGAVAGEPKNLGSVEEILKSVSIPVQFGGGLRSIESIAAIFEIGVSRAILGTAAIKNMFMLQEACLYHPGRIAVGLDTKDGFVAVNGWEEETQVLALDILPQLKEIGVARIIYTDIMTDGTLSGPNLSAIEVIARSTDIPIIASGGISSLKDIANLASLTSLGVEGAIVGKALYAKAFTLKEAIEVAI